MGIEKQVLSFCVDEELIDALKKLAKSDNRNLSNLIETILKQYVSSKTGSQELEG